MKTPTSLRFRDIEIEHIPRVTIISGLEGEYINACIEVIPNHTVTSSSQTAKESLSLYAQSPHNFTTCIIHPEHFLRPDEFMEYIKNIHSIAENTSKKSILFSDSPFIINASAQLTEFQRHECACTKREFEPLSKVYYLPHNKISNKTGQFVLDALGKQKGRYGYWGRKAALIATHLIGQGLGITPVYDAKPYYTDTVTSTPYIILCEGETSNADSDIYNAIFPHYNSHQILFVASKGSSQVITSFELLKQLKQNLEAQFHLIMLRDRDHEFPSELHIHSYERSFTGRKVLRRRALECYMYSEETATRLLNSVGVQISEKHRQALHRIQQRIAYEVSQQYLGNDYKERLRRVFFPIITPYISHHSLEIHDDYQFMKDHIAPQITPETATYQELAHILFSHNNPS